MSIFKFYLYKPTIIPTKDSQYMQAAIFVEAPQMVYPFEVSNNIENDKELIDNAILKLKMEYIKAIINAEFELKDIG